MSKNFIVIFVEAEGAERVTLPIPFELISANKRMHWAVKAPKVREWRGAGYQLGRSFSRRQRAHVLVEFDWPDKRRRDPANFHPTIKALIDGMIDAGLLPDDNDRYLDGPDARRAYDTVREPGQEKLVMLRITVSDAADDTRVFL